MVAVAGAKTSSWLAGADRVAALNSGLSAAFVRAGIIAAAAAVLAAFAIEMPRAEKATGPQNEAARARA